MSDDNAWKSFLSDSANSEATSPDSFDEELERLLDGLENVQLPPSVDGLRSTCRETSTTSTPTHFSSSDSAYSTDLTEDYSAMTYSSYSLDFDTIGDVNFVPEYNGVDPKDISVPLDISAFPDMSASFDSFGIPQFSAAFFQSQDVQIVKAQSDDGPYRPSIGISPDLLSSGTYYGPIPAIPTDAPVRVGSAIPSHTGPMRTKFVCPYCGHPSARKHNLKTHMDTHNPNRKKPFVCPASDCQHPFTRKHDLKRHMEAMHGDGAV